VHSPAEILFRLRQEAANIRSLAVQPRLRTAGATVLRPLLPEPAAVAARLRSTAYAAALGELAASIRRGRIPLLGYELEYAHPIAWRRDPVHGRANALTWSRRIPHRDFSRVGDHKIIWELNRHQHLVLLAQYHAITGDADSLSEIVRQLESWRASNPYGRGINWTSALEAAMRALSWLWILHLTGGALPFDCRASLIEGLYQHGVYLENNLSVYFSPNTHLLGEAVALYAIGAVFDSLPRAARWRATGSRIVEEELSNQVRADGSHFEQSSYYHVYALDFFLFYALLREAETGRRLDAVRARLRAMGEYLRALLGPSGAIPFLGDDDGGRLFHPYGERSRFGRASLAACAAFLGPRARPAAPEDLSASGLPDQDFCERDYCQDDVCEIGAWWLGMFIPASAERTWTPFRGGSMLFRDAGVAFLQRGDIQAIVDTHGFGAAGAGHSHASALSLVLRRRDEELLIDPGTFTYVSDPALREWFRSTAAHNTVRINGADQATPAGPFRWHDKPKTELLEWETSPPRLRAAVSYGGIRHIRSVRWEERGLVVEDVIESSSAEASVEYLIEQFWHLAGEASPAAPGIFRGAGFTLHFPENATVAVSSGWRSPVFGLKVPAPVLHASLTTKLPARLTAVIAIDAAASGE